MRKRNSIRIFLLSFIVAGSFLVVWAAKPQTAEGACKESMDKCCKKPASDKSKTTIWESLPQQFFSTISPDF